MIAFYIFGAFLLTGGIAAITWGVHLVREDAKISAAAALDTMPEMPLPPDVPWPTARHRWYGDRAADQIGRPGHQPAHDLDALPAHIRSATTELPIIDPAGGIDRTRVLAWTLGRRRRLGAIPMRLRRAQLELHARIRSVGVRRGRCLP